MLGRRMRTLPGWAANLLRPGMVPILVAMNEHHGFREFARIRAAVAGGDAVMAANVLRVLGARDLVVHGDTMAGTWDQPSDASLFALTDRGHQLADAVADLTDLISRLPTVDDTDRAVRPRAFTWASKVIHRSKIEGGQD